MSDEINVSGWWSAIVISCCKWGSLEVCTWMTLFPHLLFWWEYSRSYLCRGGSINPSYPLPRSPKLISILSCSLLLLCAFMLMRMALYRCDECFRYLHTFCFCVLVKIDRKYHRRNYSIMLIEFEVSQPLSMYWHSLYAISLSFKYREPPGVVSFKIECPKICIFWDIALFFIVLLDFVHFGGDIQTTSKSNFYGSYGVNGPF